MLQSWTVPNVKKSLTPLTLLPNMGMENMVPVGPVHAKKISSGSCGVIATQTTVVNVQMCEENKKDRSIYLSKYFPKVRGRSTWYSFPQE